jgi:hypothetical protein
MTATIDNSSDVLVFFGNEVKNGLTDSDFQNYSNDCILLPLDVAAIGEVVRSGVPYTLIDDWLGPGVVCQARAQASLLEKTWFETAKEACIAEGICWPAFDRHAMHWFWQTFTLAVTLAEEARRRPRVACGFLSLRISALDYTIIPPTFARQSGKPFSVIEHGR